MIVTTDGRVFATPEETQAAADEDRRQRVLRAKAVLLLAESPEWKLYFEPWIRKNLEERLRELEMPAPHEATTYIRGAISVFRWVLGQPDEMRRVLLDQEAIDAARKPDEPEEEQRGAA